ncbi:type II 3-dehydroquinate dehydratase [Bosea sp. NPDC055353]
MSEKEGPARASAGGTAVLRRLYILNGPNLNLLGQREPHIYGSTTLAEIRERCEAKSGSLGFSVDFRQTNFEGELVESVQQARLEACGIIINPAGYTFTSVALLDALKMFDGPKIELHISNVHARESIYHNSLVSRTATGIIIGMGAAGYELAIQAMAGLVAARS